MYLREERLIFHYFYLCKMNFYLIRIYKSCFCFVGDAYYVSVIKTCLLLLFGERILAVYCEFYEKLTDALSFSSECFLKVE